MNGGRSHAVQVRLAREPATAGMKQSRSPYGEADAGERRRTSNAIILAQVCDRLGILLWNTAELFDEASLLPGDGHFSPKGHRDIASFTAALVAELMPPPEWSSGAS